MSDQRPTERARSPATGRLALAAALLGAVIFVCINLVIT
jgi:hypothetical protein